MIEREPNRAINYQILADWYGDHDEPEKEKWCRGLAEVMYNEKEIIDAFWKFETKRHSRLKLPCNINGIYYLGLRLNAVYYGGFDIDWVRDNWILPTDGIQPLLTLVNRGNNLQLFSRIQEGSSDVGFIESKWIHEQLKFTYSMAEFSMKVKYHLLADHMLLEPEWISRRPIIYKEDNK